MKFEDILPLLREGKRARRSLWNGHPRYIRIADPQADRTLDGPDHVWVLRRDRAVIGDSYETEEDAKKALASLRREHTKVWKKYKEVLKAFEDADDQQRGDLEKAVSPALTEGHYDDVEVEKRDAPKRGRINVPMILALGRNNSVFPYFLSLEDVLHTDWNEA